MDQYTSSFARVLLVAAVPVLAASAFAVEPPPRFDFELLQDTAPELAGARLVALNDVGQLAGTITRPDDDGQQRSIPIVWSAADGIREMRVKGFGAPGVAAEVFDLGNSGLAPGWRIDPHPGGNETRAILWHSRTGRVQDLPVPDGFVAKAVSEDGTIVAGENWTLRTNDPWVYDLARRELHILSPPGDVVNEGLNEVIRVNPTGEVIGTMTGSDQVARAFRWTRSAGVQHLETPVEAFRSRALAVNGGGDVVGCVAGSSEVAAAWRAPTFSLTDLGQPPNQLQACATAINNDQLIAGTSNNDFPGALDTAWLLFDGIYYDLTCLPSNVPEQSIPVIRTLDMNDAGSILALAFTGRPPSGIEFIVLHPNGLQGFPNCDGSPG